MGYDRKAAWIREALEQACVERGPAHLKAERSRAEQAQAAVLCRAQALAQVDTMVVVPG